MTVTDLRVPEENQGGDLALASWLKKVGETVSLHEPVAELNSDKAILEVSSPIAGTLVERLVQVDEAVSPGQVIARIESHAHTETSDRAKQPSSVAHPSRAEPKASEAFLGGNINPSVLRLSQLHGISLDSIEGSGRGGRITLRDIEPHLPQPPSQPQHQRTLPTLSIPSDRIAHSHMRRTIAKRMSDSLRNAPHVTAVFEADLTAIVAHRNSKKAQYAKLGIPLTFTAYFVQAACRALHAVPEVNSRWTEDSCEQFREIHIGVGTALEEKGLVVPVLRNPDTLSLQETAQELATLTEKARAGTLRAEEMREGTFTISNHGVSGSLFAAPIILHQGQAAILGIGKIEERVHARGDDIRTSPRCYVSLTIDHRVLDAFQTNAFLQTFVESLEDWAEHSPN